MSRSCFRTETPPRLLSISHVHSDVFDCHYVGKWFLFICNASNEFKCESSRCKFMLTERNHSIAVGIVLDQTRSSTGSCNIRRDLVTHTFDATCQIAGIAAARFISESRRCIHVGLYHFCVYGIDGILFGEYCFGGYGLTEASTTATATARIKTIALF